MKIFTFFRRRSMQKQRRAEMEFNRQMAELNRQASAIKRQSDRLKAEAIHFEQTGDHKRAVAAAAAAAHQEKSYISALNTMQTCKNMHAQAKSQKALKDLISSCAAMAHAVSRDADVSGMIAVQNDFAQTMEELEQSREALEAAQEGFNVETEVQVRNEAGEEALAQLMGNVAPVRQEPARIEEPKSLAAGDSPQLRAEHKAWADERLRVLGPLVANE